MTVKTVVDILKADSGVAALVAGNVFPLIRPQNFKPPAVTAQNIQGVPANSLQGDSGLESYSIQVDCWALQYQDALALATACRKAINLAGHLLDRESDNFTDEAELSGVFRITQEYSVWLNRS